MKDVLAASPGPGNGGRSAAAPSRSPASASSRTSTKLRFQPKEGLDAAPFAGQCRRRRSRHRTSTPELEREGLARDFIRLVQVARKDAGFNVADRIAIEVKAGPLADAAIAAHLDDGQARDTCRFVRRDR
jgi:isoleucyl-tRNA synthetase